MRIARLAPVLISTILLATTFTTQAICAAVVETQRFQLFDNDWRFLKQDAPGAEAPTFDDSNWRKLDVPHDWSIEGPFDEQAPAGGAGAFLPAGIGWYRKSFTLPAYDKPRRVFIEFDGVMANSEVWVNGHSLGKRPFGYVSFHYDMTDYVHFGDDQPNVLAVRCDNSQQPASRWYAGAGIYRHARLIIVDRVSLDLWPQYVTTPEISPDRAIVKVVSTVYNKSDRNQSVDVQTTLIDPNGREIKKGEPNSKPIATVTVPAGQTAKFEELIPVPNPKLWDLDHPQLYHADTHLYIGDQVQPVDESITTFGIRDAHFDTDTGFWLNGKNIKLKGVCLHHDAGALGAAVPASVLQRRLESLKAIGCNAIRTSHNPPQPELLDLCDRLGLVVMDEMFDCWTAGKNRFDYHLYFNDWWKQDVTDTVLRDRNHPSIVIYSAGNEIRDINPKDDRGAKAFTPIRDLMHELDPTRPVTVAVLRPNQNKVYDKGGFAELMDVVGQNYRENEIVAAHKANPKFKIIGTENHHEVGAWVFMRDDPAYSGQFLWTGYDYLGESRAWPSIGYGWGLFDRNGTPHGIAFQRESWWGDKPMVHIVRRERPQNSGAATNAERLPRLYSDWNPKTPQDAEGKAAVQNVEVYSNCDQVELLLNDKSLGAQLRPADNASPRQWKVPFEPGTIRAIASNGASVAATHELRTAGKPAKVKLESDREQLAPNWEEVAYVRATIVDENGTPVPAATGEIKFEITGPGKIIAVDAADPDNHALFQATQCKPYQGLCCAIVRSTAPTGQISLTASTADLPKASISISVVAAK